MNTLKNTKTNQTWIGTTNGSTFISDKIRLDFDHTQSYTLDGVAIKIIKHSTDNMYRTTLDFEEI